MTQRGITDFFLKAAPRLQPCTPAAAPQPQPQGQAAPSEHHQQEQAEPRPAPQQQQPLLQAQPVVHQFSRKRKK